MKTHAEDYYNKTATNKIYKCTECRTTKIHYNYRITQYNSFNTYQTGNYCQFMNLKTITLKLRQNCHMVFWVTKISSCCENSYFMKTFMNQFMNKFMKTHVCIKICKDCINCVKNCSQTLCKSYEEFMIFLK